MRATTINLQQQQLTYFVDQILNVPSPVNILSN